MFTDFFGTVVSGDMAWIGGGGGGGCDASRELLALTKPASL